MIIVTNIIAGKAMNKENIVVMGNGKRNIIGSMMARDTHIPVNYGPYQ
jgi:hypothetical protein